MPSELARPVTQELGRVECDCDVLVAGGGMVGASVAYHLAKEGRAVTVIERGEFCAGTSGATFAWVGAHGQTPLSYHLFRRESVRRYETLREELGTETEYRATASLELVDDVDEWGKVVETTRRMQGEGYALRAVEAEELYELEPNIARRYVGATLCPVGGVVNPFKVTLGFLRAASEAGAVLCPRTELRSISLRRGRVSSVTTSGGELRPRHVVLAAGVATAAIGREIGISIPVRPVRGQVLVTEPMPPFLFHIVDDVRQTTSGNILIGRTDEERIGGTRTSADGMAGLAGRFLRVAPALRGVRVIRAYAGLRPMPADGFPILGAVPGAEGLLVAVMHSGITLAPLAGDLIAKLVTTGSAASSLRPYLLERFVGGGQASF